MNFTLCVNACYAKCLHRPIVIINQQYTKGEIHFISDSSPTSERRVQMQE